MSDPDHPLTIDVMSETELRAYDMGCEESLRAFGNLLDHPLERSGVGQGTWQTLRQKFWRLYDLWSTHLVVTKPPTPVQPWQYMWVAKDGKWGIRKN